MYRPEKFKVYCENENCTYVVKVRNPNKLNEMIPLKDENGDEVHARNSMFVSVPTRLAVDCIYCSQKMEVDIPDAPVVRSEIKPVGLINVYRISSEAIKQFLINKAKCYQPDVMIETHMRFISRKKTGKGYAAMRIAFSEHAIERKGDSGFFDRIQEEGTEVRFIDSIFKMMVRRYVYNKKAVEQYLNDYKLLEDLEEKFGIDEKFLNETRQFTVPRRIPVPGTNQSWVFFEARPEEIIRDMLEDPDYNVTEGKIVIENVIKVNDNLYEYIVHVHANELEQTTNPEVRRMLNPKG